MEEKYEAVEKHSPSVHSRQFSVQLIVKYSCGVTDKKCTCSQRRSLFAAENCSNCFCEGSGRRLL